jgi:hypothetical protein
MLNALNIKKIVYGSFAVFIVVYFLSAFLSPVDAESLTKYNISELQLRLLAASILLPVVIIWACAAYGFVQFKQYALSIKGSPHGKGTNTIANSLGIIALQLLVTGSLSVVTSVPAIGTALGGEQGITMIESGLEVSFAIATAIVIYQGAGQLIASLNKRPKIKIFDKSFWILAILSAVYVFGVVGQYPSDMSADSLYSYAPLGVVLLFSAIPYIFFWNLSLVAIKKLYAYRRNAKGKVYREAFGLLTAGLLMVVGSSVLIQLLGTIGESFANLNLTAIVAIVYVLILAIGVGYLFIARAATRLRRVEN